MSLGFGSIFATSIILFLYMILEDLLSLGQKA